VPLPVPVDWVPMQMVPLQVRLWPVQQGTSVLHLSPDMGHPPVVVPVLFAPVPAPPVPLVVPLLLVPQATANATIASRAPRRPNVIKLFMCSLRFREGDFHGHSF
jgi:hypothetical protein